MKCPPMLFSKAELKVPGISLRLDCRTLCVRSSAKFVPGDQYNLATEDGIRFPSFQGRKADP